MIGDILYYSSLGAIVLLAFGFLIGDYLRTRR